ncbi:GNAT family N-acetyltransferase [Xylanibacillus composti]|uniref:Putative N-acetyltransferase n=1 Tax=Xylanibacillus composti TaxID=1572762 RepID=A0A8J4H456_9BACL|nr:GNAT family N-acetyltransferase [Xylanibacillus composti]MDT9725848.1 GNAT family N-acetyltransferase [Xylanibacillus composti]GIQ69196.1 putative N-acetyltransferase [Xylanibacillus composti]
MFVRAFQLSDYAPVSALLNEVLSEECCEDTMAALGRQLYWDSELIMVAVQDDQVVGVMIGTIDEGRGYYYRVAVHPDYQRMGIGTKLTTAMRDRFEKRQVSRIMISMDKHNEMILPWYESLGYRARDFFHSFEKLTIVNG